MRLKDFILIASASLIIAACSSPETDTAPSAEPQSTISVYSTRHYDSDRIMYKAFEEKTGIRVRFREGNSAGLLEAMKVEGTSSPADVVISADAGTLWRFQEAGLLQPVTSETLQSAIPATYREPGGHWFGLSKRARIIVFDPERLDPQTVQDYRDLSSEALQDEVCMRSSANIYNLSLMAELIERWGIDEAQAWASQTVANFARQPTGGDTTQIESIAAGECSVALVNHYYWVRMATSKSDAQRRAAGATQLVFPETETGTHVNVTGGGVAANAPNREGAIAFLEFLASPEGQSYLVAETKEFPMVEGVEFPEGLDLLPAFKASTVALTVFGENQSAAQTVYDRAGWK